MSRSLPILLASAIAAGASAVHADDDGKLVR